MKEIIKYENPAPFTLWQLNSLFGIDANSSWENLHEDCLGKEYIKVLWDWYEYYKD